MTDIGATLGQVVENREDRNPREITTVIMGQCSLVHHRGRP